MKLRTEIHDNQFPRTFERFEALIGAQTWRNRARQVREEIRGNPYLREWLTTDNAIVLALDRYSAMKARHGGIAVSPQIASELEAMGLVTQTVGFVEAVDEQTGHELVGRVRGALKNPADLRGLALELMVATHLQRQGAIIHLPQGGTYDWMAERSGLEFEAECKSISRDKGRQVHGRDAIDIAHLVTKGLGRAVDGLTDCMVIEIMVPQRLPTNHNDKQDIAEQVRRALIAGQDLKSSQVYMRQMHLPLTEGPAIVPGDGPTQQSIRVFLEKRYGMGHGHYGAAYVRKAGGILMLVIGSRTRDSVVDATMDTLHKAAANQLTGTRPGILCAKFEDISDDDLKEVAKEGDEHPSALRIGLSKLLQSSDLDTVAQVVLMADGPVIQRAQGQWTRAGTTYVFTNLRSRLHNDPRLDLFG